MGGDEGQRAYLVALVTDLVRAPGESDKVPVGAQRVWQSLAWCCFVMGDAG